MTVNESKVAFESVIWIRTCKVVIGYQAFHELRQSMVKAAGLPNSVDFLIPHWIAG